MENILRKWRESASWSIELLRKSLAPPETLSIRSDKTRKLVLEEQVLGGQIDGS